MAIFSNITSGNPFTDKHIKKVVSPWRFDAGAWTSPDRLNNNFRLVDKKHVDFSNVPEYMYEDRVVEESLRFVEIGFDDDVNQEGWHPAANPGEYSVRGNPSVMPSRHAIRKILNNVDSDGLGTVTGSGVLTQENMPLVESLERGDDGVAVQSSRYHVVDRFTGIHVNGVELDPSTDLSNIDTSFKEFILEVDEQGEVTDDFGEPSSPTLGGHVITLSGSPSDRMKVEFTRGDLFVRELPLFSYMTSKALSTLQEGDYTVIYSGDPGLPGYVEVYFSVAPQGHWGFASFRTGETTAIKLNQSPLEDQSETISPRPGVYSYNLGYLPIRDTSYIDSLGALYLDTQSLSLTVGGTPWTRVEDLSSSGPADTHFELDPYNGVVTVGDNTNGQFPTGDMLVEYSSTVLVQWNESSRPAPFLDEEEDIDPKANVLRSGYLVMDSRNLTVGSIEISTPLPLLSSGVYGPLGIPAVSVDDVEVVLARVMSTGSAPVGIPNVLVEFEDVDGVLFLSSRRAMTDWAGYARIYVSGRSRFDDYVLSVERYRELDEGDPNTLQPNPDTDLTAYIPPWGYTIDPSDPKKMVVPVEIDSGETDLYLLLHSIPSLGSDVVQYTQDPLDAGEYPVDYNAVTQTGGIMKIWSEEVSGAQAVVHPISITPGPVDGTTELEFAYDIPVGKLITSYKVVVDRIGGVRAYLAEDNRVRSNVLDISLEINEQFKGQWKLPELKTPDSDGFTENEPAVEDLESSRIGSATFITPNAIEVTGTSPASPLTVGNPVDILGSSFPTQPELKMSVFIIKTNADDEILAVLNITDDATVIDSSTIQVSSLPAPPTGVLGDSYWIAVGGFDPSTDGTRDSAVQVTIN